MSTRVSSRNSRNSRYVAQRTTWVQLVVVVEVSFLGSYFPHLKQGNDRSYSFITGEVIQNEIPTFKVVLVGKFCTFNSIF